MDRTIDILAGTPEQPAETPAGGTLATDFGEQLILLSNRLTAIEAALTKLSKSLEKQEEAPAEAEPEEMTEEQSEQEEAPAEVEPETPAEREGINNEC